MKEFEAFKILNSSEAQKLFIELGYSWSGSKGVRQLDKKYLFANKCGGFGWSNHGDYFVEKDAKLITLDQLFSVVDSVNKVN